MKFTVRMTRREIITVESLLHMAVEDGSAGMLFEIAEGFNEGIAGTGIRRLNPLSVVEADRLAARLSRIEQRGA